jgi:hypothetical protein
MNDSIHRAQHIALFVYYFPPQSSSGAKRMEALAKYAVRDGRKVTVITPTKSAWDGLLSEPLPSDVTVLELNKLGRLQKSPPVVAATGPATFIRNSTGMEKIWRKTKDLVLRTSGQLIDHRLPFAVSVSYPWLDQEVRAALQDADVAVGTCPPWPPLLGALNAGDRFGVPAVLDYRDQLSCCHEMPGTALAKRMEVSLDRYLTRRASSIVTISEPMRRYYSQFHSDVVSILNGYDQEKINAARKRAPWKPRSSGALTVRYLGVITEGRIPRNLLEALKVLHECQEIRRGDIKFEFYGNCRILQDLLDRRYPEIRMYFTFFSAVPYAQSLELIVSADHLLFCENMLQALPGQEDSADGILTTKLYEYLASERPILGNIPRATLAAQFILRSESAHFASQSTAEFLDYMRSDKFWHPLPVAVGDFVRTLSREVQSNRYLAHLDAVVARSTFARA